MSTSSSTAPSGHSQNTWTDYAAQYLVPFVPPIAAGLAIIPVFPGMVIKSATQTHDTAEPFLKTKDAIVQVASNLVKTATSSVKEPWRKQGIQQALRLVVDSWKAVIQVGCKDPNLQKNHLKQMAQRAITMGCHAAPTVGVIVGSQMYVQSHVNEALKGQIQASNFSLNLMSAGIVGFITAPALAIFNGQSTGTSVWKSLRGLSPKQTSAIVIREMSFLFALSISDPISKQMKSLCGDNKAVEYSSIFATNAMGSLVGHPADTALTIWQGNRKIINGNLLMGDPSNPRWISLKNNCKVISRDLMKGSLIKAATLGIFSILFVKINQTLQTALK